MKRALTLAAATALALVATACHDDDAAGDGSITLKQFAVRDLANTRDDTEPVEINDLFVDTSNEDPAQYDALLPPG
ncbi:MAG: hypothetical protein ACRES8_03110 [Nevskiaceae bacterium]